MVVLVRRGGYSVARVRYGGTGHEVLALVRREASGPDERRWDPDSGRIALATSVVTLLVAVSKPTDSAHALQLLSKSTKSTSGPWPSNAIAFM